MPFYSVVADSESVSVFGPSLPPRGGRVPGQVQNPPPDLRVWPDVNRTPGQGCQVLVAEKCQTLI